MKNINEIWYKLKINKGYTRKVTSLYRVLRKIGYYNNPEIKYHKIIPRTPEHNGKVERSHRNDSEMFYSYLKFYGIED